MLSVSDSFHLLLAFLYSLSNQALTGKQFVSDFLIFALLHSASVLWIKCVNLWLWRPWDGISSFLKSLSLALFWRYYNSLDSREFFPLGDFVEHTEFLTLIASFRSKRSLNRLPCDFILSPKFDLQSTLPPFSHTNYVNKLHNLLHFLHYKYYKWDYQTFPI